MIHEADKRRMKAFCDYLEESGFFDRRYIACDLLCIDENNRIKKPQYEDIYEAFLAREEVAINLHDKGFTSSENSLFIDNIERAAHQYKNNKSKVAKKRPLVKYLDDSMVLTMQNEFRIKRFGIVKGENGLPIRFIENPLHIDIRNAMEDLVESF